MFLKFFCVLWCTKWKNKTNYPGDAGTCKTECKVEKQRWLFKYDAALWACGWGCVSLCECAHTPVSPALNEAKPIRPSRHIPFCVNDKQTHTALIWADKTYCTGINYHLDHSLISHDVMQKAWLCLMWRSPSSKWVQAWSWAVCTWDAFS